MATLALNEVPCGAALSKISLLVISVGWVLLLLKGSCEFFLCKKMKGKAAFSRFPCVCVIYLGVCVRSALNHWVESLDKVPSVVHGSNGVVNKLQ